MQACPKVPLLPPDDELPPPEELLVPPLEDELLVPPPEDELPPLLDDVEDPVRSQMWKVGADGG